jgi:hypothetical protein
VIKKTKPPFILNGGLSGACSKIVAIDSNDETTCYKFFQFAERLSITFLKIFIPL